VNLIYLEYYKTSRGDNPVKEYILKIDNLDEVADIMETIETVDLVGASYLISGGEDTRSLGNGLWEIKKSKHRFYYVYCLGNRVYMLHACYKQKGKAEKSDIDTGKRRMKDILAHEKEKLQ
jgi:phage-related protein